MKKAYLFLTVLLLSFLLVNILPQANMTVFTGPDDFERASLADSYESVVVADTSTTQAYHGAYSARVRGDEYFTARENTTDMAVEKYLSAWVYVATMTPSANWWQDVFQMRNGSGNLMAIYGLNSPDSGSHYYYHIRFFNMTDYSITPTNNSVVEVDPNNWHFWVLRYKITETTQEMEFYLDGASVVSLTVTTTQQLVADGFCIGGQKTGGYSSYEYVDGLQFTDVYPSDPFGAEEESLSLVLSAPADDATVAEFSQIMNYTPTLIGTDAFYNATLYVNETAVAYNQTVIENATLNGISYAFPSNGTYLWDVQVWNSTMPVFSDNGNFTLEVAVYEPEPTPTPSPTPEPLAVEDAVVIGVLALALALCAFAYLAVKKG